MKKLWLAVATVVVALACQKEAPISENTSPDLFSATFEDGNRTRTYVDGSGSDLRMHWTAQDSISIFFSTYGQKYIFQGQTGDNGGVFSKAQLGGDDFTAGFELPRYYAVFPHARTTSIDSDGTMNYTFPATQNYAEGSFGLNANPMVAVTADRSDRHLTFKNAAGYLKLLLYGGATVDKITLRGNNGEVLTGLAQLQASMDAAPTCQMANGGGTLVTLQCGGVQIAATAGEATPFWIVVPPVAFEGGFTVEVTDNNGGVTTKATNKSYTITRNHVTPMAAFEVQGVPPTPPEPEIPDLLEVDSGLPILYVFTPDGVPVDQKETWIAGSQAYLKNTDGTVDVLGSANIRGRGNTTWNYIKKPYAFKLDTKAALLGMPADKRWDLLANFLDRTRLRNDLAFELGRRLVANGVIENWWTPKGKYVELVLNNVHMGNYYLCEHIKISKNRVNIKEMKTTDIGEDTITGGYLLECGIEMDEGEGHQFWTNYFPDTYTYNRHGKTGNSYHLPVMIKSPEDIVPEQFNWIKDRINQIQGHIVNNSGGWTNEVDIDSFICWMFIEECVSNYEPFHPKSSYMHLDRGGKLVMGPLWDFDFGTFDESTGMTPIYHYAIWYPYMLKNAAFKARVKELWPSIKAALREVCAEYATRFTQSTVTPEDMALAVSIDRDYVYWKTKNGNSMPSTNGDESMGIWAAFKRLTDNLSGRINQMNGESGLFE